MIEPNFDTSAAPSPRRPDPRAVSAHGHGGVGLDADEHRGDELVVEVTRLDGLVRPAPRERFDRRRQWSAVVHAIGVTRIAGGVAAVVVAGVVGWWLLRPPPIPVEDTLPMLTVSGASPSASSSASHDMASAWQRGDDSTGRVVVHVAGAVRRPGVYRLPGSRRVADAVARAGGATRGADLDRVNLAASVVDGQQILIPERGRPVPSVGGVAGVGGVGGVNGVGVPTGPVDLNTADLAALDALPGIGPTTAAAIIAHRDEMGPFAMVDDLLDVAGIGPAKLAAIRDLVTT